MSARAAVPYSVVIGDQRTPVLSRPDTGVASFSSMRAPRAPQLIVKLILFASASALLVPLVYSRAPCSSTPVCGPFDHGAVRRACGQQCACGARAMLPNSYLLSFPSLSFLIPLLSSLHYVLTPPEAVAIALDSTLFSSPRSSTASKPCADPGSLFDWTRTWTRTRSPPPAYMGSISSKPKAWVIVLFGFSIHMYILRV
ncbi:hypothetical protein K438DRAFT_1984381 [Mycena galopus ATCC 62051]|nr:hypothetical protein K438DRAFT_1984381 [Mycena galopus ATCC 62051]